MARLKEQCEAARVLDATSLSTLFEVLLRRGYDVIGPTVRDGAIVLEHIQKPDQLPQGQTDEQTAGHYGIRTSTNRAFFGYAVGPHSWKKYTHPAEFMWWSAQKQNGNFRILNNEAGPAHPFAFLGVRACDLKALARQDRVMIGDQYHDPVYTNHRKNAFIVAVQCTQCAETCFCASLDTGPREDGTRTTGTETRKVGSEFVAKFPLTVQEYEHICQQATASGCIICDRKSACSSLFKPGDRYSTNGIFSRGKTMYSYGNE